MSLVLIHIFKPHHEMLNSSQLFSQKQRDQLEKIIQTIKVNTDAFNKITSAYEVSLKSIEQMLIKKEKSKPPKPRIKKSPEPQPPPIIEPVTPPKPSKQKKDKPPKKKNPPKKKVKNDKITTVTTTPSQATEPPAEIPQQQTLERVVSNDEQTEPNPIPSYTLPSDTEDDSKHVAPNYFNESPQLYFAFYIQKHRDHDHNPYPLYL